MVAHLGAVVTTTRSQYDHVASIYLPIAVAVFALVALTLFWFLFRYRASRDPLRPPGEKVEATRTEAAYAVVLALVTAFLVTVTFRTLTREDQVTAAVRPDVHVDVVGAQWSWRFVYRDRPGVQVVSSAERHADFVVPAGRRVQITAWSQDVLHDFWIPDLRFQRQVWPDHRETFTLVFPHTGSFQGLCAWFCGLYHDRMDFTVRVLTPARYDAWLAAR